ncbi:hypothetical protein MaudCBS49596_002574 [Microsporum audouinii]
MSSQGRQTSSLQQPKEPPKKPNISSPASLLWAHQLHREQNALSAQMLELEASIKASITTINESMMLKLDAFTGQLNHLKSEVEQLRRDGAAEADKRAKSLEDKLSERLDSVDDKLLAEFGRNTEMTSELVRVELGRYRDEIIDAIKTVAAESKQQAPDTSRPKDSVPPLTSLEDPSLQVANPALAASNPFPLGTQPTIVWQKSVRSLSTNCDDPEQASIRPTAHPTDIETREHINHSVQAIIKDKQRASLELIMQGSIPLSKFLELGPTYTAQGHAESQVVEALWKGLNDPDLRRLVAKEMPDSFDQWTCTKFRDVARMLDVQKVGVDKDAEKATVKPAEGRRKKRRRVISLVWPTEDNEDEG